MPTQNIMTQKFIKKISLFIAISPWFVCSQTTLPKVYSTTEISSVEAPEMDGFINDKIWNNVPWGSNFIEVNPIHTPIKVKILGIITLDFLFDTSLIFLFGCSI